MMLIEKGDCSESFCSFSNNLVFLAAWGSVEWHIFPHDIPPFFVSYGFAFNENLQDFLEEGVMPLLIS